MGEKNSLKAITGNKKRPEKESGKEINLLYETGQKLSATLNVRSIFNTTFDSLCSIMDCDELLISSFDSEKNLIKCEYIRETETGKRINVRTIPPIPLAPKGYGIQSRAIRSKEAIIINDYEQDFKKVINSHNIIVRTSRTNNAVSEIKFIPRSVLVIPMKLKNNVIGVIQIFSKRENAYTVKHLKFAESLAHLAALAYNNAVLFENAKKEIAERKAIEDKLIQLVKEKEIMVREVHHRVKNNLYAISSLLKLQTKEIHDPEAIEFLDQSSNRVKAISIIHDKLYKSNDPACVNFELYVSSLIEQLYVVYGITACRIKTDIQIKSSLINIDTAIPCALIINELVSNSFKHAFPNDKKGIITLKFYMDKKRRYVLKYCDDGIGLDKEIDFYNVQSLGTQLINMLKEQVNGEMEIKNEKGFRFTLKFKA